MSEATNKATNKATPRESDYEIADTGPRGTIPAPELGYRPRDPQAYRPRIALIGCGGISASHLRAYRKADYDVAVLCDLDLERARKRQEEFFPNADLTTDFREVLRRDDIEVVDLATHPPERLPLIEASLEAGKHVLSQKPFVTDLDVGERLVEKAAAKGVRFAVNQNGRWAPHFSYLREAVRAGHVGDLLSVHAGVHWDHSWTKGTPFERIYDLVFYDFAIHWFDFISSLLTAQGRKPLRVQAERTRAFGQEIAPPLLAQAILGFEGGQASLIFDAAVPFGKKDHTYIAGTKGTLQSEGPDLGSQTVTLTTEAGIATPTLAGSWFPDGFHGTMAELLCAIEENREPQNSARDNLSSLALCFATLAAANEGVPKAPGAVRRLPEGSAPMRTAAGR